MVTEKERLLAIAKEALGRLPVGAEFQLSDLVAAETWTKAPKGARLAAGMAFRAAMNSDARIDSLGRDAENHQRYRKTSH